MTLEVIDYTASDASQKFAQSLREIGFGVLANAPLDFALIDEAYAKWSEFFKTERKHEFTFDKDRHDGYISPDLSEVAKGFEIKDIKEFFHFYPWGRCPQELRELTTQLFNNSVGLANILLSWLEKNMPAKVQSQLTMPLSKMAELCPRTMLRVLHYPPLTGNEPAGAVRAAAHEDINLLTILPAATAKGLQVLDKSGNWLDVPCDTGWVIVNAGDMLQECTDFYYPATTHRVINPEGESAKASRLSMPLFLHANDEVRLSERYTAGSYLDERYAELGLK